MSEEIKPVGAIDDGAAEAPLTPDEIKSQDDSDLKVLKIVLQDVEKAQTYVSEKRLPQTWNDFDDLFRAYVVSRTWPGSDVPRSNLGMPIILEAVEEVLPQIFMAFFSEEQPFYLDIIGKPNDAAKRAASSLIKWAIRVSGFKEEIRLALKSSLLYGFQVSKYGWRTCKHKSYRYEREQQPAEVSGGLADISVETAESNKITRKEVEVEVSEPTFENFHLRNVLFDPTLARQDVRKGKWLCFQFFPDLHQLDDLRQDPTYKNIPSDAEILAYFANRTPQAPDAMQNNKYETYRENQAEKKTDGQDSQADPKKAPIQVLEYWDAGSVVTVLRFFEDWNIVIRNSENEFGNICGLSNAFIDVLGAAYGFGIGHLLRGEQRLQQGVLNAWVDQLALTLRPAYQRIGAANGGQQNITISPGLVRNEQTELKPLVAPDISGPAENALNASDMRAGKRVGLSAQDMPTQALRTGSGVQSFQAAIAGKLQYFVEIFAELVFIPALEAFLQMCKDRLTPQQMNQILTEEQGKAFEGDIMDVYNGKFRFSVLTSTKLAARKAAAQLIPTFVQLFASAPVNDSLTQSGEKVSFGTLSKLALDLAGYPTQEIIVPMTDEDKKRAEQNSPAAIAAAQMQGKAAMQQQDQQNKLEQIDERGQAQAGNNVVKSILKANENDHALQTELAQTLGGQ